MSRLRPAPVEDHYGYVSRVDGDQRLIDPANQEDFFARILAKNDMSAMPCEALEPTRPRASLSYTEEIDVKQDMNCLASLRKLREGIIAAQRRDVFARDVLERTINFAILVRHSESYLPCMRHLLKEIYPRVKLSTRDIMVRREILELYLLHLCSMPQYDDYYLEKTELNCGHVLADDVVQSLVQGNWTKWHRIRKSASKLRQIMIDKTQERFAEQIFSCISASYMRVEASWITHLCGGDSWRRNEGQARWEADGSWIVLKKSKKTK